MSVCPMASTTFVLTVTKLQKFAVFDSYYQWGICSVWEIRAFPILLSGREKNCPKLFRSGNKMINFIYLCILPGG